MTVGPNLNFFLDTLSVKDIDTIIGGANMKATIMQFSDVNILDDAGCPACLKNISQPNDPAL
jgi:hypothetical protein